MSQYLEQYHANVLEKFEGFLGYLGLEQENMSFKPNDKLMFCFDSKETQRLWLAFYTAYSTGYK